MADSFESGKENVPMQGQAHAEQSMSQREHLRAQLRPDIVAYQSAIPRVYPQLNTLLNGFNRQRSIALSHIAKNPARAERDINDIIGARQIAQLVDEAYANLSARLGPAKTVSAERESAEREPVAFVSLLQERLLGNQEAGLIDQLGELAVNALNELLSSRHTNGPQNEKLLRFVQMLQSSEFFETFERLFDALPQDVKDLIRLDGMTIDQFLGINDRLSAVTKSHQSPTRVVIINSVIGYFGDLQDKSDFAQRIANFVVNGESSAQELRGELKTRSTAPTLSTAHATVHGRGRRSRHASVAVEGRSSLAAAGAGLSNGPNGERSASADGGTARRLSFDGLAAHMGQMRK